MRYYVVSTINTVDGIINKIVYGDFKKKNERSMVYISNNIVDDSLSIIDSDVIETVFNNPIKSLRSAKVLLNKMIKNEKLTNSFWHSEIKEYPDDISFDQFSAFVRW